MRYALAMRYMALALIAAVLPAAARAQGDDPVELLCTENRARINDQPAGPLEIKLRVSYRQRLVELLTDDGRVIYSTNQPEITSRTIKWGVGIYGLNTWKQLGLSYNVSNFEGSVDRESGSGDVAWFDKARGRDLLFRGRCRLMTQKF